MSSHEQERIISGSVLPDEQSFEYSLRPERLMAVTVASDDSDRQRIEQQWREFEVPLELHVVYSPYRELTRPVMSFLDELDRKMILVRATGRVLKLAECGIPKVKRFAVYDQVHTTGMDIDHTPNAMAIQTLGKVDILVNNAGMATKTPTWQMSLEMWQQVIDLNLTGVFLCTRAVSRSMLKARRGRIINITSVVGAMGNAGQVNYAAAKAGLEGFSRALAAEVASRGVTVNTLSPGYIASQAISSFPPDVLDRLAASVPVRRLGRPEEVAGLCAWLASDEASYVTGADYPVNGGLYMG